jgi:predicted  nucleic acid-binding Zn-ribbon protein
MLAESDKQIERLRGELDRERERNGSLRHEVRRLQDQVDELERTVARHKLPPIE